MFLWAWARELLGRNNGELQSLISIISAAAAGFHHSNSTSDRWSWELASNGQFNVKKLASLIDKKLLQSAGLASPETLRNNLVPKKIEILVWRLLKKRLPVRVELDKSSSDLNSVRCPICDDNIDSVEHTFLQYKYAAEVWARVYRWWKLDGINPCFNELCSGKTHDGTPASCGFKVWQAVQWVCVYTIWRNRNMTVFQNKGWGVPVSFNEIKVKSFEWISHRLKGRTLDWLVWLTNPSVYLDLV
ncbi:uncharacterized protein [Rutidosis leptorrhynchoides]|uniref:uncharacterized protein n=1 Tax=Rutidosis leptorrhynchoides TaxID=125765 RepID=UPI003A992631